jgi:hypothetical protein
MFIKIRSLANLMMQNQSEDEKLSKSVSCFNYLSNKF